ncbi:ORF6N domain-containing protein [Barnesiella sp. WM24]|uniref:ORF6N domain-containing protein n=1 Tax=Barnesiella sp. WM24 TaxID=2558278 RepID=UPI001071DC8A|nr:ORF6N domain-containing protein [Barnesiella sp. WM24]TFU91955.1 ORF6N domain-containing protein [Barnesiella sp. WM24]
MKEKENNILEPVNGGDNSLLLPIESLIHVIRGQQVMLDSDLARLYGVETRVLNQAVKRNIERFPEDFMFQLTKEECLKSQIVILNTARGQHLKYMPYAFTENGVAMLSSVLRSKTAIEVNIRIMRAFTSMRSFLMNNAHVFRRLEAVEHHQLLLQKHLSEHDKKIEEVLTRLDNKDSEPIEGFFFEGQIFDAYTLISDLIRKATTRIILIDNYVDDRILKVLTKRKEGVAATIYTDPRHSQINNDLRRHNAQYPPIEVRNCTNVHDRFLIIDNTVYFIGGSIKDLGKKIVAFSQMQQNPDDILSRLR